MRGLKALVIGMGILLVGGLVVLVVAAVQQAGNLSPAPVPASAPTSASAPVEAKTAVELPAGAEIVETRVGDGRIVLRLKLADGNGRLVVLDAATGRTAATVELKRP